MKYAHYLSHLIKGLQFIISETAAGSKSDSWIPINNVAPASEAGLSTSDSVLGTVRDEDQEKEVQEEKPDSATVINSPQKEYVSQVL